METRVLSALEPDNGVERVVFDVGHDHFSNASVKADKNILKNRGSWAAG